MAVMDEFKEEREALRNGTPKEKLSYFWYYYKWHVIGTLIAVILIGSFVHQLLTRTETVFDAVMMNTVLMTQDNAYEDEFAAYLGIDPKEEDIMFDTSIQILENSMDDTTYTSVMKLSAYTAAGDLDVMVTDTDSFRKYANSECFFDLRTILTDEQLVKYEPYFYYVDQKIIDEINTISDDPERLDELDNIVYPDPTKPEEMETPIPVGIYLDNSKKLRDNFYFRGQDGTAEHIAIGIYVNTSHLENALKFLEFAFEG